MVRWVWVGLIKTSKPKSSPLSFKMIHMLEEKMLDLNEWGKHWFACD